MGSGRKLPGILKAILLWKSSCFMVGKGVFSGVLLTALLAGCDFQKQQAEQVREGSNDNGTLLTQSSQVSGGALNSAPQAVDIDLHPGKALHDANCISCHDATKYQSVARRLSDFPALLTQVRRCNANLNPRLSDGELKQVADYLQQAFYNTTGTRDSEL